MINFRTQKAKIMELFDRGKGILLNRKTEVGAAAVYVGASVVAGVAGASLVTGVCSLAVTDPQLVYNGLKASFGVATICGLACGTAFQAIDPKMDGVNGYVLLFSQGASTATGAMLSGLTTMLSVTQSLNTLG